MIWRTQLPNQVEYVHSSFGKLNSSMNKHPRLKKKKKSDLLSTNHRNSLESKEQKRECSRGI